MKMWHQSWPRVSIRKSLLTLALLLFNLSAEAKLGAIDTLEQIITAHSKQYKQVLAKVGKSPLLLDQLEKFEDMRLSPYFLKSILFQSEYRFLKLAKADKCTFYALLENNLLKTTKGEIKNLLIDYKNKDGKKLTALVAKDDFFKHFYKTNCFTHREIKTLFLNSNLKKTLESIQFPKPKTKNQCLGILKEWQENIYTPYLCRIPYIIKKGRIAKKKLALTSNKDFLKRDFYSQQIRAAESLNILVTFFQKNYLENLCESITDEEKFCGTYLASDVWTRIINGEFPKDRMKYKCKNVLNLKKDPTIEQLRVCARRFTKEPKTCETDGTKGFKSLFPMNNCNTISEALRVSHLKTDYHDCPGMIDNAGIVNIHRITNHITPRNVTSNPSSCSSEANFSFAKLYQDFKNEEAWPLKICYDDKLKGKDVCISYVPGLNNSSKLSESSVIEYILKRMIKIPSKEKCRITPKNRFNPNLLEYKVGCHIVYDNKICTSLHCPKKVYYNKREVKGLRFTGKPVFDYFPNSFSNEKYSIVNILKETKKIYSREIRNLTELKVFLDSSDKSIVHGIGCIEDIYPTRYPSRAFNQCTPIPFIVDGYFKKHGNILMSLRTALDDVHSPRPVVWNYLFNAVSSYKELHPLKLWSLNGIK